jgi:signal transduction histidine kinase
MGLGLAMTHKLVMGLEATVSADSEFGQWSEFVVALPLVKSVKNRI